MGTPAISLWRALALRAACGQGQQCGDQPRLELHAAAAYARHHDAEQFQRPVQRVAADLGGSDVVDALRAVGDVGRRIQVVQEDADDLLNDANGTPSASGVEGKGKGTKRSKKKA